MNLSEKDILNFYIKVSKLKQITRRGWIQKGMSSAESVADHTFGVCILSLLYAIIHKLDIKKVLIMGLLHDIAEIRIGDITPLDNFSIEKKKEIEAFESKEILSEIDDTNSLYEMWLEFENCLNEEGKLVKQIDKLEVALQALVYEKEQRIDFSEFYTSVRHFIENKDLLNLLEEIEHSRT